MRYLLPPGLASGVGRRASAVARQTAIFGLIALAVLAVCAHSVASPASATSSLPASQALPTTPPQWNYGGAIADLDGDGRTDLVTVTSKSWGSNARRYQVNLHLSARADTSSFSVSAEGGGLRIVPRDVDGDGDLDLVITSARSLAPVGVWINDGHGGFAQGDASSYSRSIWTEGPGISAGDTQRIFPAICTQSGWSWLGRSRAFRFWGELPIERLWLCHASNNFPEVTVSRPRSRAPPCSLPPQTN